MRGWLWDTRVAGLAATGGAKGLKEVCWWVWLRGQRWGGRSRLDGGWVTPSPEGRWVMPYTPDTFCDAVTATLLR